ncbi:MAG: sialate O-acetylesterase, partial [Pseudomonadota bacterium]
MRRASRRQVLFSFDGVGQLFHNYTADDSIDSHPNWAVVTALASWPGATEITPLVNGVERTDDFTLSVSDSVELLIENGAVQERKQIGLTYADAPTISMSALVAGQTYGPPGSGAEVEPDVQGATPAQASSFLFEFSIDNGSTFEAQSGPAVAVAGQEIVVRISGATFPFGPFFALSSTVTVTSGVVYPGPMLTFDQAEFNDTSLLSVTPTPDDAIQVVNGVLTVDGTQAGNKNVWQTPADQPGYQTGDLYAVVADLENVEGGTVFFNNSNNSNSSADTVDTDAPDLIRQAIFEMTGSAAALSVGFRTNNGRSYTSEFMQIYNLQPLLAKPQAIFLTIGQSNWIGASATYDKANVEVAEGCLYTPPEISRNLGANDYISAPGEMLPMMPIEPMAHISFNEGFGPGQDFCKKIRETIPFDETPHYFAGGRAAAGFKDGDRWDGELVGGLPTGGDAYVKWWEEARKLWTRAQAWNSDSYIAGVVICVGESDLGGTWDGGANAQESVEGIAQMIDDIRSEWGANIPVVISEIGYDTISTNVSNYIAAQQQLAAGSGNATLEKTRCTYVARPSGSVFTDGTHYDAATNRQRGIDAAQAMAALIAQPLPVTAPLITDSPDAAGEDEFTYTTDL